MHAWRAIDQQPVTTRLGVAAAMEEVVAEVVALARSSGTRPVVVACWQDAAYVHRPAGLLERLAAHAEVVVACAGRPMLPGGVEHAVLEPDEELAAEWSLVAVTPVAGVVLETHELDTSLPAARVEDGRVFRWELTVDTDAVVARLHRLVRELGARISPLASAALRSVATSLVATTDPAVISPGAGEALRRRIEGLVERADAQRDAPGRTPPQVAGLTALADWLDEAGPRSPALGMIVVHGRGGPVTAVLRGRAHTLDRVGGLVVDVPPDAAMLVMPGLVGGPLRARTLEVRDAVAESLGDAVDVRAIGAEVPAVEARRDLVGSLGRALVALRGDLHDVPTT